ncbi:MAG: phosphate import ATP-binding protein PstB [Pirellulaceae bacterium]|nr:MAG: phosphate import ATP-binding protein PstB [Pirellulaceae bacterium]
MSPNPNHQKFTITGDDAPVIDIRDLTARYGGRTVLRQVSLQVRPLRILTIVGPSGCGKSTLLASINRLTDLIPDCHITGEIRVEGQPIFQRGYDVRSLRRRIGWIAQRPTPFPLSIWENLELPMRDHGLGDRRQRQQRIEQVLHRVGLWEEIRHRLHAAATELSGGQQQRLCIARAILLQPTILLLDEPCSHLDPLSAQRIELLIKELRQSMTIVLVTHHLAQARRLADDLAFFWWRDGAGELVEWGAAKELFTQPQHRLTDAYLSGDLG